MLHLARCTAQQRPRTKARSAPTCAQVLEKIMHTKMFVCTAKGVGIYSHLQGYLANKNPPPVGPYSSPMPRDLW